MKLTRGLFVCFLCAAVIPLCNRDRKGEAGADTAPAPDYQVTAFYPPADSVISPRQMSIWFGCNAALDTLSGVFTRILSAGTTTTITDSAQKYFSDAQNHICRKNGLKGGYAEYLWILNHLGDPKNEALFDSMNSGRIEK